MKAMLRRIADVIVIGPLRYIRFKTSLGPVQRVSSTSDILSTLYNDAIRDSATYAQEHMQDAMAFEDKRMLWDYVIDACSSEGIYAEFGVWKGESINHFARRVQPRDITIFGFDSFEGLKEDWPGLGQAKGHFSLGGAMPQVERNVVLKKGWFDQTIPDFLRTDARPIAFAHIDCDTYKSTRTMLALIFDRITTDTIMLFDEYFGYSGWRREEWKAWQEFVKAHGVEYEYVAFSNGQAAVRIRRAPA
jgi:methyltransferase family protein